MKTDIQESLQFVENHPAVGSELVQHAQNLARQLRAQPQETKPAAPEIIQAAKSLLHICMELTGVIAEYYAMPCDSLETRMFVTYKRYTKRILEAQAVLAAAPQEAKAVGADVRLLQDAKYVASKYGVREDCYSSCDERLAQSVISRIEAMLAAAPQEPAQEGKVEAVHFLRQRVGGSWVEAAGGNDPRDYMNHDIFEFRTLYTRPAPADAVRNAALEEAADACEQEYHTGNGWGITSADLRCADIIRALQSQPQQVNP